MNASNDHHGRLDFGMRTLALTTQSKMLREVYTPRSIHHIEPAEAKDLPLWMDFHLKGTGPAWPEPPKIEVQGRGPEANLTVTIAQPGEVESVTGYYGLNNPWPTSRFYRTVPMTAGTASLYTGQVPVLSPEDTIYAFANVAYRSGIHLSTRLVKVAAKDFPGIKSSLQHTALMDAMEDDRAWFWWLAGTDPLNQTALLEPWTGPAGEHGFTHAQPGGFSFATMAPGDPQFKSDGTSVLLIDVWAANYPAALEVSVATKFFQPGQGNYKMKPVRGEPVNGWITLRMPPAEFHDDKGAPLTNWKEVDFFCLSGTGDGLKKTVFKNLRREKID
jgi:hypothetical protein